MIIWKLLLSSINSQKIRKFCVWEVMIAIVFNPDTEVPRMHPDQINKLTDWRLKSDKTLFDWFSSCANTTALQHSQILSGEGWRCSVQKTLWGHAANVGSKISFLVYQWTLIWCNIRIWMGWFQNFPKFEPKFSKNLRKFLKKIK